MAQILDEKEIMQLRSAFMSDNTAFMKWSTEIEEKKSVIDSEFMHRNRMTIIGLDKFAPLANFTEPRLIQLHKLKMLIIGLEVEAGLDYSAEQTALSAIDDIQVSRGDHGFYQRALITQRQEQDIRADTHSDAERKVGFFNKLFAKKEQPPQGGQQQ